MKHLEQFEGYDRVSPTDEDYDEINKEFLDKIKSKSSSLNGNYIEAIYADLELLKKDKINSFIYHIIRKYLIKNEYDSSIQSIMKTAVKFFDTKYGEVIEQFKKDLKAQFKDIENNKEGNFVLLPYGDEMVKVPRKIGHKYIPLKILPMEDLYTKYSKHKRLKAFAEKGLKCVHCPKEGKYLIAAKDVGGGIHIDIYTKDFDLMTVDHIKPKSKGGTYDIENLDPMCATCNTKKSNKYEEPTEEETDEL